MNNIPIQLTDKFENLKAWQLNETRLLLDLRPHPEYYLKNSTYIPINLINERWFELPNKWKKFSILLSSKDNEEELNFLLSLIKKGWLIEYQFHDTEQFFINCSKLNLITNFEEIKFNILFDPNFYLKSQLNIIQNSLSCLNKDTWKVMDLGCGSGRDLAYLGIQSSKWKCWGIDSWKGSINRCELIFNSLGLQNQLEGLNLMKFCKDGSLKDLITGINYIEYRDFDSNNNQFDLIIIIRFLIRENFELLDKMINIGGFLLVCTFINLPGIEYESPKGNDHRLEVGELKEYFVNGLGYELIDDSVGYIEDGRPVNCFLARKQ